MPAASANDSGSDAESSNGSRQSPNASEAKSKQRGRPKRQSAVKPASSPPVDEDQEGKDEEGEGDEDEEMDEDVFIVEDILDHMVDEDGTVKFKVKWEGWDNEEDLTWEPEENLSDSANAILRKYLQSVGGMEAILSQSKAVKTKKRGRPSAVKADRASPQAPTKRSRREAHPADSPPPAAAKKWAPPAGSWEDHIDTIDAQQDTGTGKLVVYLTWKTGQKTRHPTEVIYKKCPQLMLKYYEQHIRVIQPEE